MAEWSKATVSKIVVRFMRTVGSNPTLSAIFFTLIRVGVRSRRPNPLR